MSNKKKLILDLCGGTGSWSKPYADSGYTVLVVTWPEFDVTQTTFGNDGYIEFRDPQGEVVQAVKMSAVYGVLAAPPCTMFSFARTNALKPRDILQGMRCVRACLDIIWRLQEVRQHTNKKTLTLKWWALENPFHGFLKQIIGRPAFTFDPWEFGDGYQKRTALWGHFTDPKKRPVAMTEEAKEKAKTNSHLHTLGVKFDKLKTKEIHPEAFGKFDRQTRRSITPAGFAQAFFKANQ